MIALAVLAQVASVNSMFARTPPGKEADYEHICYMCIYIYIYIYIYVCFSPSLFLSLSLSIYIFVTMHVYIYIYVSRPPGKEASLLVGPTQLAMKLQIQVAAAMFGGRSQWGSDVAAAGSDGGDPPDGDRWVVWDNMVLIE